MLPASGDGLNQDAKGQTIGRAELRDDYTSDPAGNAGDRVACGVVMK